MHSNAHMPVVLVQAKPIEGDNVFCTPVCNRAVNGHDSLCQKFDDIIALFVNTMELIWPWKVGFWNEQDLCPGPITAFVSGGNKHV